MSRMKSWNSADAKPKPESLKMAAPKTLPTKRSAKIDTYERPKRSLLQNLISRLSSVSADAGRLTRPEIEALLLVMGRAARDIENKMPAPELTRTGSK